VLGDTVPTSGDVLIDGVSSTDASFADVRKAIAYVGPNPAIFQGTILENLTCFQSQRSRFAREMAVLAGLERAVNELPNGYDTLLGTTIDEIIPASVAQQITIVRALSTQPRVLLFDEATAILDRHAEAAFITTIAKLRGASTVLVATHRPSLLATADVVYKVADGKILQLATAPSLATAAA
jgi:ATP-binding cassette, subfamily C, bacterial LapB